MVERACGHLKGRFPKLLNRQTDNIGIIHIIVTVCDVLPNLSILHSDETEIEELYVELNGDDDDDNDDHQDDQDLDEPSAEL